MNKETARVVATATVWAGTSLLAFIFHLTGHLDGGGAGFMYIGAVLLTAGVWWRE